MADARWLVDNIVRKVEDGWTTMFWEDPWLDDVLLTMSYARLFELTENKLVTVMEMFVLGWGVGGEMWKWRRMLFAWEEGLVGECERLSAFVLQDSMSDRWMWKLHSSHNDKLKN